MDLAAGVDRLDVRKGIDGDDEYGNTSFAGGASSTQPKA